MAPVMDIKFVANAMPHGPQPDGSRDHHLLVWLVKVLFLGGWAVLGHVLTEDDMPFVSFRKRMEYLSFVR